MSVARMLQSWAWSAPREGPWVKGGPWGQLRPLSSPQMEINLQGAGRSKEGLVGREVLLR